MPFGTQTQRLLFLLVAIVASIASPVIFAHDYWIDKDANGFTLHQGHKHSRHAGDQSLAYDPTIVKEAYCADARGHHQSTKFQGKPVRITGECSNVAFDITTGYWTKTPWDTFNQPRSEVKGAIASWLSEETVTRVQQWRANAQPAPIKGLQLVLADDPGRLQPGEKFTIRAFVDGKPQPAVAVAYDGETRGTTDAEGRINLRSRHGSMQIVSASLETPLADGKADTLLRGATLNFVLP